MVDLHGCAALLKCQLMKALPQSLPEREEILLHRLLPMIDRSLITGRGESLHKTGEGGSQVLQHHLSFDHTNGVGQKVE